MQLLPTSAVAPLVTATVFLFDGWIVADCVLIKQVLSLSAFKVPVAHGIALVACPSQVKRLTLILLAAELRTSIKAPHPFYKTEKAQILATPDAKCPIKRPRPFTRLKKGYVVSLQSERGVTKRFECMPVTDASVAHPTVHFFLDFINYTRFTQY